MSHEQLAIFRVREGVVVSIGAHEVRCVPVVVTRPVAVPVGGGCVNDSWEDVACWRAVHPDNPNVKATADTPEEAARLVLQLRRSA